MTSGDVLADDGRNPNISSEKIPHEGNAIAGGGRVDV
jgi:hypothetical protein